MNDIVLPEEGSHWYTREGEACHEVPCKTKKGVMRAVSLRWDRHLKLFPSVTNVLNIKAKPGLDVYKVKQAIMSSLTLPRIEGEEVDDFAKRVVVDMNAHRDTASAFGNKVHKGTENFHQFLKKDTPIVPYQNDDEVEPYIASYKDWLVKYVDEVYDAEKIMVNSTMGYAGTVDLRAHRRSDGRRVIIDTKTQAVKNGKPKYYDTWLLQLRAYGQVDIQEKPVYVSAVINSAEPSPVVIHEWPEKDYRDAWRAFQACHYLWCWDNNYWPTTFWHTHR